MKTQAGLGWMGPDAEDILVTNRTGSAVAVGDVERLDNTRVDGDSTTNTVGLSTAGLANIVVPLLGDARGHYLSIGIFGVVQQAVADDAKCRFRLRGYCDSVSVETTIVLATAIMVIETAKEFVAVATSVTNATDAAVPHKVVFIPLTARTGAGLTDGWWNGITGFGTISSIKGLT